LIDGLSNIENVTYQNTLLISSRLETLCIFSAKQISSLLSISLYTQSAFLRAFPFQHKTMWSNDSI